MLSSFGKFQILPQRPRNVKIALRNITPNPAKASGFDTGLSTLALPVRNY